jgi:hypothetical protein
MVDANVGEKDSNKLSGPVFSEKACCSKLPSNVLTSYDLLCTVWDPDLQSWLETCLVFWFEHAQNVGEVVRLVCVVHVATRQIVQRLPE